MRVPRLTHHPQYPRALAALLPATKTKLVAIFSYFQPPNHAPTPTSIHVYMQPLQGQHPLPLHHPHHQEADTRKHLDRSLGDIQLAFSAPFHQFIVLRMPKIHQPEAFHTILCLILVLDLIRTHQIAVLCTIIQYLVLQMHETVAMRKKCSSGNRVNVVHAHAHARCKVYLGNDCDLYDPLVANYRLQRSLCAASDAGDFFSPCPVSSVWSVPAFVNALCSPDFH